MALAVKYSSSATGGSSGEYSFSSGEVIDSSVSTQTNIETSHAMTSNGPVIHEIGSRSTTKTVFWVRFDSGKEAKYTIGGEIDILKGQRVSLIFVDGKANVSRLVGLANHSTMECINLVDPKKYVQCLRPNRGKIFNSVLLATTAGLVKYFIFDPLNAYEGNNAVWMCLAIIFGGSFIYVGLFYLMALCLAIADSPYRTFKKEVSKNLTSIVESNV